MIAEAEQADPRAARVEQALTDLAMDKGTMCANWITKTSIA